MEGIGILFESFMKLFNHHFTVYGFTISFFEIFILSILVGLVGYLIANIFGG